MLRTECTADGSGWGRECPPLCDIPSGCRSFTGPWTVTRSPLRMLRRVAAFCRPLRPVLPLVSFPRSRSPVVGVLGLCPPPPPHATRHQHRGHLRDTSGSSSSSSSSATGFFFFFFLFNTPGCVLSMISSARSWTVNCCAEDRTSHGPAPHPTEAGGGWSGALRTAPMRFGHGMGHERRDQGREQPTQRKSCSIDMHTERARGQGRAHCIPHCRGLPQGIPCVMLIVWSPKCGSALWSCLRYSRRWDRIDLGCRWSVRRGGRRWVDGLDTTCAPGHPCKTESPSGPKCPQIKLRGFKGASTDKNRCQYVAAQHLVPNTSRSQTNAVPTPAVARLDKGEGGTTPTNTSIPPWAHRGTVTAESCTGDWDIRVASWRCAAMGFALSWHTQRGFPCSGSSATQTHVWPSVGRISHNRARKEVGS